MVYKNAENQLPVVAVSACLLGHAVRYDGSDKAHQLLANYLSPYIETMPVCPEAGAGLGVPRPPVQLVQIEDALRAIGRDDADLDVTNQLISFANVQADVLEKIPGLCGHIFKSRSPSCGLGSTPIHNSSGDQLGHGHGLYAQHIAKRLPWLLLIEDIALDSPEMCRDILQKLIIVRNIRSAASQNKLLEIHHHYFSLWNSVRRSQTTLGSSFFSTSRGICLL